MADRRLRIGDFRFEKGADAWICHGKARPQGEVLATSCSSGQRSALSLPGRRHRAAFLLLQTGPDWQPFLVGISLRQFEQMKERLGGAPSARAARLRAVPSPVAVRTPPVILGVDPSLRGTGYGIIAPGQPFPKTLAQGTIHCPTTWERSRCLLKISETLRTVIAKHQPTVCVIEGIFFVQNLKTALIMGEARGAALAVLAEAGLEIYEIATRKVKQAIVGYGAAQKSAVATMVQRMLNLSAKPEPDAADALALALTHAREASRYQLTPLKKI
jgi:crossover junction endodeoxyribonuclease RuvC